MLAHVYGGSGALVAPHALLLMKEVPDGVRVQLVKQTFPMPDQRGASAE